MTNVSGEILEPFSEEVRRALKKLLDSTRVPEELSHAISDLQHTANQAAMQSQFAGYDPDVKAALAFIEKCERARDELVGATYNSQHRPLTITDAAGQTSTFTYKNDKVISVNNSPDPAVAPECRPRRHRKVLGWFLPA